MRKFLFFFFFFFSYGAERDAQEDLYGKIHKSIPAIGPDARHNGTACKGNVVG